MSKNLLLWEEFKIMRTNKILEKLLAIILIFTLTSANFMFVTKAYATSLVETLFGGGTSTGHDNVSFDAYFAAGETAESLVVSDVNNEELAISMKIDVQESGYLKDAKVEILEAEGFSSNNIFKVQTINDIASLKKCANIILDDRDMNYQTIINTIQEYHKQNRYFHIFSSRNSIIISPKRQR